MISIPDFFHEVYELKLELGHRARGEFVLPDSIPREEEERTEVFAKLEMEKLEQKLKLGGMLEMPLFLTPVYG